jgi:formylglycine-generating enzyme required for sulfatase activity/class 3 adenylate cyclase
MEERSELRTILTADIPGFSGRLAADEASVLKLVVDGFYAMVHRQVSAHGGTLFRKEGDAVWCMFGSIVAGVRAAIAIQEELLVRNARERESNRFGLRIGIHLGDVVITPDGDVLGNPLSLAKRLETACAEGAIMVSEQVHAQVAGRPLPVVFQDLGEITLKGLGSTRVFQARINDERRAALLSPAGALPAAGGRRLLVAADLDGWQAPQEARTAWEREAVRLANVLGGSFLGAGDGPAYVAVDPAGASRDDLFASSLLSGPRTVIHCGEVLARGSAGDWGGSAGPGDGEPEGEALYGATVEEADLALASAGRAAGVVLLTEAAAREISAGRALDLEPAGTIPGPAGDVGCFRLLAPGAAPPALAQVHAPRAIGTVCAMPDPVAFDVVCGVRRERSDRSERSGPRAIDPAPPGRAPARAGTAESTCLLAIHRALAACAPACARAVPVLSLAAEQALARDPAIGLAVALALHASATGRALPPGVAAFGIVTDDGSVVAPPDAAARAEEAARVGVGPLIAPVAAAVPVATLAAALEWLSRRESVARLAALVAAQRAGALTVIVAEPASGAPALADLTRQLAGDAGSDPGGPLARVAEDMEAELSRDALIQRFGEWARRLPPSPLAAAIDRLAPSLLVLLFPDPRFVAVRAAAHARWGGTLDQPGSLVLTERDVERALAGLADLPVPVRERLAGQTALVVGSGGGDATLKAYLGQVRALHPAAPAPVTVLVASSPADPEIRMWRRRDVEVIGADPVEVVARIAAEAAGTGAAGPEPAGRAGTRRRRAVAHRPYKVLDYDGADDHAIFFGRDREVAEVSARLLAHPLLVLYGRSGAGKSSLVRAGVLSRLKRPRNLSVVLRSISEPTRLVCTALDGLTAGPTASGGRGDGPAGTAGALVERMGLVVARLSGQLVVVLDQFEEFFVRHTPDERARFLAEVGAFARRPPPRAHLVFCVREDFLAEMEAFEEGTPSILDNRYRLPLLSREAAREAIQGPAELFGIRFDESVVDALTAELFEEGIDPPQLSIVCDRLYETRDPATRRIDLGLYERLGGVRRILVGYLQSTLARGQGEHGALARKILSRLVTPRGTKAVLSLAEIACAVGGEATRVREAVLELVNARLVRELTGGDDHLFELAHEYLIQEVVSWTTDEELALRHARIVLRSELENWQRFGSLIGPDRLAIMERECVRLAPSPEEHALLVRAAAIHGRALEPWLAPDRLRDAGIPVLVALLEEAGVSAWVQRRILEHLFRLPVDDRAADRMLAAAGRVGNPALLAALAPSWAASGRPGLAGPLERAVRIRFAGPGRMVHIPAGPAILGSTRESKEERKSRLRPDLHPRIDAEPDQETVEIAGFWIDRHLVTNDEFAEFRPCHLHRYPPEEGNHPAVYVSWYDACAYAEWLGNALPTEQEWEKAARGADGRLFPWGCDFASERLNSAESGLRRTTAVGSYPSGASPYGCMDMAGNVWEWTSSPWSADTPFKTQKGGSSANFAPLQQSSARYDGFPDFILSLVGFRTACRTNPWHPVT